MGADLRQLGRVLIIGGGRMGSAILAGMMASGAVDPSDVTVANPGAEKRERLSALYGVSCVADASEASNPDTCILAVKPQVLRDVLAGLVASGCSDGPFAPRLVISVAAGISTDAIGAFLPGSAIVRAMPNTPLTVGRGVVGVSLGAGVSEETGALACAVFERMGDAVVVDEELQDAVVAVSGSGPAYFALFAKALAEAGTELGLPAELSARLAIGTMAGTAALLEETGTTPDELIEAVSSPGGTTIAALDAMRAHGVEEAIVSGAHACAARSKELGD